MNSKAMKSIALFNLFIGLVSVLSGCTKQREATFPDGQGENLIDRAAVESANVTVSTSSEPAQKSESQALRADAEADQVKVTQVEGSALLAPMFKDLWISGKPSTQYKVKFSIDHKFVTAHKVVSSLSELSATEAQIASLSLPQAESVAKEIRVPIFQFAIDRYGVVIRSKNDLGEETAALRLKETEWASATHIEFSTLSSKRIAVGVPAEEKETGDRIFSRKRIDDGLFSQQQLDQNLQIGVALVPGMSKESIFHSEITDENMALSEVTTLDSATLSQDDRDAVKSGDEAAMQRSHIKLCSDSVRTRIAALSGAAAAGRGNGVCVEKLRYLVQVSHVRAVRRTVDQDGTLSAAVEYRPVAPAPDSNLIQIVKRPSPISVNPVEFASELDPAKVLSVSRLKDAEFSFRRTLQDSPNGFDYTFAGSSGNLELVKFVFEKERVRVVRSQPLLRGDGSTSVDLETLLSVPARYKKMVETDSAGNRLPVPQLVTSSPDETGSLAFIDWAQNTVPNVSSALDYYGLEQCFGSASEKQVAEATQTKDGNVFGFSLLTTYSSNPALDCAGLYAADYFDTVQANFTFKERLSFMRYEKADESPLLDVPYEAQKRLGFGIFTYKKKVPNPFGNVGTDGTEVPLPSLFDLRNGKKVTYVLGGLPEDSRIRERVITATREVVADLNGAFKKAFAGTSLERSDDVVELKIEGQDIEPAQMGDLNRNYIYYVPKRTSSGVIGLGGAHHHPRSGIVTSASVFIYGGNILSAVEHYKKVARAHREYEELIGTATKAEAGDAPVAETARGVPGGARNASLTEARSLMGGMARFEDLTRISSAPISKPSLKPSIKSYAGLLTSVGLGSGSSKAEALAGLRATQKELSFYDAVRHGVDGGYLTDSRRMEAEFNKSLKSALAGRVSARAMRVLEGRAKSQEAQSLLLNRLEQANICVYQAREAVSDAGIKSIEDMDDLDAVIAIYKPTLAHELGHNFGLRHNFISSFDKKNWKFDADENTPRTYSSIMDYLADDHDTYDGFGPQDVAAFRFGYTGLLELSPEALAKQKGLPLVSDRFVSTTDYRKALGIDSWNQLDSKLMASLPLKNYLFCSDEEAGTYPVCNRFDRGTTPSEIVKAALDDYNALYSVRNFPNNRLDFNYWNSGAYVGKLFSIMVPARQFLEETIFQAINGADGEVINAYASAAVEALQFFHQIIRTPDAPTAADGLERFKVVKAKDGTKVLVERKWLKDVSIDLSTDRIRARGVEFDKVVALLMLTERSMGFQRYEQASLRFSFPEFERLLFGDEPAADMPTASLLTEILLNQVAPAGATKAGLVRLGGDFKAETTETLRFFAVLGSIVNLDVDGLEQSANNSTLYRVMSGFKAPFGSRSVLPSGVPNTSVNELRYWAGDAADSSKTLVSQVYAIGQITENKKSLVQDFSNWIKKQPELKPEELAKLEKDISKRLARLPEEVGIRDMAPIGQFILSVAKVGKQLDAARETLPDHDYELIADSIQTGLASKVSAAPILGIAVDLLADQEGAPESFGDILPTRRMETDRDLVFGNLRTLNRLFFELHPEYARR